MSANGISSIHLAKRYSANGSPIGRSTTITDIRAFGCRGPEFRSMEVRGGHAVLKFDFAPNGLSFFGKNPSGFEIAGKDRIFHPAEVRICPAFWGNEGLEVWNDNVTEPVAVRYGYTNYVDGALYNTEGLPASSFRTDNW